MPKDGERTYFKDLNEDRHSYETRKPFSDRFCGRHLAEMGAIMTLIPPPPARVLDLGCGLGWTSRFLALRGYDVTAVDISWDAIEMANVMNSREGIVNLNFVVSDYEDLDYKDEFDVAVFFESLHHAESEEDAIRTAYKALKKGGLLITSEPGRGNEKSRGAIEAREKYNVTERDMPPKQIKKIGKQVGFKFFQVMPHANSLVAAIYANEFANPLLGKIIRFPFFRNLIAIYMITAHKYLDGIVLMRK